MENKKQSSIEEIFSHIKASRNDIQYWNDSMLVDWLLEQEDRLKAMHKEEIINAANNGCKGMCYLDSSREGKQYYTKTFGGNNE
jgi:hypothetical protein